MGRAMVDRVTLKNRASGLRRNQTTTERLLWSYLRMRQMCGTRFLRQYVIGSFIVDFYAPSIRFAIELDGGQHYALRKRRYDAARSKFLAWRGVVVLRYTNLDVKQRLDDVLRNIENEVLRLQAHPPARLPRADAPTPFGTKGVNLKSRTAVIVRPRNKGGEPKITYGGRPLPPERKG